MTSQDNRPNFVFTLGLPAAGKSTIAQKMFGDSHRFLCADTIKATHPSYDPKACEDLHTWSKSIIRGQLNNIVMNRDLSESIVYERTSLDAFGMVNEILRLKQAGFNVSLLFVTCPLSVSLERNALRTRQVPTDVIASKAAHITSVFEQIKHYASTVQVVDNSTFNQDLA